jgi:hypothetical protein
MATLEGSALVQHCISKALDSLRQRGYNVFLKCEQRQEIIQLFVIAM